MVVELLSGRSAVVKAARGSTPFRGGTGRQPVSSQCLCGFCARASRQGRCQESSGKPTSRQHEVGTLTSVLLKQIRPEVSELLARCWHRMCCFSADAEMRCVGVDCVQFLDSGFGWADDHAAGGAVAEEF